MMEFEDEHEEEEEEEEEDEEMGLTPPYKTTIDNNNNSNNLMVLKKHATPTGMARYRECLKNHAVTIGGHAVDGCGEFMPAGAEGTLDSLRCAACNCHRNFHRKEHLDVLNSQQLTLYTPRPHHPPPQPSAAVFPFYPYSRTTAPMNSPPPGYIHVSSSGQPTRPLALPSPGQTPNNNNVNNSLSERVDDEGIEGGSGMRMSMSSSSGKKRFRTKFTPEQKDKMLGLAEKLGWRIQKQDEPVVQQFCDESGVKRQVLKVWMHNNKHTLGKKP